MAVAETARSCSKCASGARKSRCGLPRVRVQSARFLGALTLSAGDSVLISAGESRQSLDEGHQHTSKGFLSKKTAPSAKRWTGPTR